MERKMYKVYRIYVTYQRFDGVVESFDTVYAFNAFDAIEQLLKDNEHVPEYKLIWIRRLFYY